MPADAAAAPPVNTVAPARAAPATARFGDERAGWTTKLGRLMSRDYPLIWSMRLDFPVAFALIGGLLALVPAAGASQIDDRELQYFWAILILCGIGAIYWMYLVNNAIRAAFAPRLRNWSEFGLCWIGAFLIFLPAVIYAGAAPVFVLAREGLLVTEALGLERWYLGDGHGYYPGELPGGAVWSLFAALIIAILAVRLRHASMTPIFAGAFLCVGAVIGWAFLMTLLDETGIYAPRQERQSALVSDLIIVSAFLTFPVVFWLGRRLFSRSEIVSNALLVASNLYFLAVGSLMAAIFLDDSSELFEDAVDDLLDPLDALADGLDIAVLLSAAFLLAAIIGLWVVRSRGALAAPRAAGALRSGVMRPVRLDDARSGLLAGYKNRLSRDFPLIWNYRLDMVLGFAVIASLLAALSGTGAYFEPNQSDAIVPSPAAAQVLYNNTPFYFNTNIEKIPNDSGYFIPDYLRRLIDRNDDRIPNLTTFWMIGCVLFSFYWLVNVASVIQVTGAPALRWARDVWMLGGCALLLFAPVFVAGVVASHDVQQGLAAFQTIPRLAAFDAQIRGYVASVSVLDTYVAQSVTFAFAVASGMGLAALLVRRYGAIEAFIAVAFGGAAMIAGILIYEVVRFGRDLSFVSVIFVLFILLGLVTPQAATKRSRRRVIQAPALASATTVSLFFLAMPFVALVSEAMTGSRGAFDDLIPFTIRGSLLEPWPGPDYGPHHIARDATTFWLGLGWRILAATALSLTLMSLILGAPRGQLSPQR